MSKPRRLELDQATHERWDRLIESYNRIVDRVNKISYNRYMKTASFKTKDDVVINLNHFYQGMRSTLYKLKYASISLEYLRKEHMKRIQSIDKSMGTMTDSISEDFIFHLDIFFSFAYSAFEIIARLLHMGTKTNLKNRKLYFTTIIESLSEDPRYSKNILFANLRRENEKGWIQQFRQYRIFFTHYAFVPLSGQFKYTARNKEIRINIFMLPDDPKDSIFNHSKEREAIPYCEEITNRQLEVMKELFDFIYDLI